MVIRFLMIFSFLIDFHLNYFNCLGQSLSIGRPDWNPLDSLGINDYEYHPKVYRDSIIIYLEDVEYLDTNDFKLFFSKSGFKKISRFVTGIHPRPIVFAIDGNPIFGSWIISSESSFSCNWITCIVTADERYWEIQLGYPKSSFKYYQMNFDDIRKNNSFIKYFVMNDKIK